MRPIKIAITESIGKQHHNPMTDKELIDQLVVDYQALKKEIHQVIIGQDEVVDQVLIAIFSRAHCLLVGVPGLAKTLLVNTIAQTLGLSFNRIQFTPDLMPSDIVGSEILDENKQFKFIKGPIFSNLILADEINRTPPKTQAALLEAMQERSVTAAGNTYTLPAPFFVLATQNPIEQEGTYRLPEAQLDRFLFKIEVQYPSLEQEVSIIENHHQSLRINDLTDVMAIINAQDIIDNQQLCRHVVVESKLIHFIAQLIHKSRNMPELYLGASTRASVSILNASKAYAVLRGRDFVTPDDIIFVAKPILRHRIILTPEKEMEGIGPNEIIDQLIKSVEIPR